MMSIPLAGSVLLTAALSWLQPSYTGLWYRLDSQSDDADAKIQESMYGFVDKQSRGRTSADEIDPRVLRRLRRVFDAHLQYPEEVFLEESARELVIDDGGPRVRIYYIDGEEHERQMPNGVRLETTVTRVGNRIDAYQKTSEGAEIYETYQLAPDGERMTLTVRLEDKQLKTPLIIRSVYTRAP